MKEFIPQKEEKEVISIRIESNLLDEIDATAAEYEISRNSLIVQCIKYAMENRRAGKFQQKDPEKGEK